MHQPHAKMNFNEITIFTSQKGLEALPLTLEEFGATGFVINDPRDFENFLNKTVVHWDYLEEDLMSIRDSVPYVRFYAADNKQGKLLLENTENYLKRLKKEDVSDELGSLEIIATMVNESDWENNWKAYFKPFKVGERFYIKPSWESLQDPEGRTILEIDPASSFGTGTHHTTQLCLSGMEKLELHNKRILDMGCGSGILGVGAILLGAKEVVAVDIDENCARTTAENMDKNNISAERYKIISGEPSHNLKKLYTMERFDIIFANIVADVIIGLAPDFAKLLVSGGWLITSGIIGGRKEEVKAALISGGFKIFEEREQSDWVCFTCRNETGTQI